MVLLAMALATPFAYADERVPGKEAIQRMLTSVPVWNVYQETTPEQRPGERAHHRRYRFFVRDGRLMGEFVGRAPGHECLEPVTLRDDGFNFKLCPYRDQPETEIDFDPADARFPFKRVRTPTKWWFGPDP